MRLVSERDRRLLDSGVGGIFATVRRRMQSKSLKQAVQARVPHPASGAAVAFRHPAGVAWESKPPVIAFTNTVALCVYACAHAFERLEPAACLEMTCTSTSLVKWRMCAAAQPQKPRAATLGPRHERHRRGQGRE